MEAPCAVAKRGLRRRLSERRRGVAESEARAVARIVAESLAAEPRVRSAPRVALYAATAGEVPSRPLFDALGALGVTRLLPRVCGAELQWVRIEDWEALAPGRFEILAPPPQIPGQALAAGDVAVLPGLAFDARGWRLGRGAGFYDRAFPAGAPGPLLVGVAYGFQVVAAVPHDSRDRRVDAIVTERGLQWVEA